MARFNVPTRADVSPANQQLFDALEKGVGMVPNLFATLAHNETALGDYLTLQNRKSTLRAKEREVINLVVSQVNGCDYCQAAHTAIGQMQGFTSAQILEIRSGTVSFDPKLNALARFVKIMTETRGHPLPADVDALIAAGYNNANIVDIVIVIGDKMITNFLFGVTQVPIDFPLAPALEMSAV